MHPKYYLAAASVLVGTSFAHDLQPNELSTQNAEVVEAPKCGWRIKPGSEPGTLEVDFVPLDGATEEDCAHQFPNTIESPAFNTTVEAEHQFQLPRCGKDFKGVKCPHPNCCSDAGYCGTTPDYCKVPGNCQKPYGRCDSDKTPTWHGKSPSKFHRQYNDKIPAEVKKCTKPQTLALTFDDGPSEYTADVLDVLAEFGAHATFFLGGNINGRGTIDNKWHSVVSRMYNDGHQIGSHTWSHPNLDTLTSEQRKEEMYKNEEAIINVVGSYPTFMRAPRVICSEDCQRDMHDLGYHIVGWEVDSEDWREPRPSLAEESDRLVSEMDKRPEDGNMFIIQHDTHENAAEVTRYILQNMKSGWHATTLVECLGYGIADAMSFDSKLKTAPPAAATYKSEASSAQVPGLFQKTLTFLHGIGNALNIFTRF